VTAHQGDAAGLAARIADVVVDPERYVRLSEASVAAAQRELSYDFAALYERLLVGDALHENAPEPTLDDIRLLIDLMIHFAEQRSTMRLSPAPARTTSSAQPDNTRARFISATVQMITPFVMSVLKAAPWLAPTAHKIKHALLRS
jgi:hypothetical protein